MKKLLILISICFLLFGCDSSYGKRGDDITDTNTYSHKEERIWDADEISTLNNSFSDTDFAGFESECVFERQRGSAGIIGMWYRQQLGYTSYGTEIFPEVRNSERITFFNNGTYERETFRRTGSSSATGSNTKGIFTLSSEGDEYRISIKQNDQTTSVKYSFIVSANKLHLEKL